MEYRQHLEHIIADSIRAKQALLADAALLGTLDAVVAACVATLRADGKILFCGNGGSAADAQHLAAEFSGRFYKDRPPLYAEALHVNGSYLTAVANDYSYEEVYARMVEAMGRPGDLLFALSTSGNSPNILRAAERAGKIGLKVVGMTGAKGGALRQSCDWWLAAPSDDTPRIQEVHMLMGHALCQLVEAALF